LLVVAENAELAELVAEAAARLGAEVDVRASGRAALAALVGRPPDLAVLDLPLPDLAGPDVLSALGRAGVPAIGVSGVHRGPAAAEEARRIGASGFFEKPFSVDGLLEAAGRLLGAGAPGSAADVTEALPLAEVVDDTAEDEPIEEIEPVAEEDVLGEAEPLVATPSPLPAPPRSAGEGAAAPPVAAPSPMPAPPRSGGAGAVEARIPPARPATTPVPVAAVLRVADPALPTSPRIPEREGAAGTTPPATTPVPLTTPLPITTPAPPSPSDFPTPPPPAALLSAPLATPRPHPLDALAAPIPGSPRERLPRPEAPPPRRGDLSRTSVPRILVALHVAQATGAVHLSRGATRKIVVVERGAPVYSASNVGAERLGAICVRRGVVGAERLEALRREKPGARTADLLAGAGLLAPGRRAEIVAGQVRAIVWSTFGWTEGSYRFELARPPEDRVRITLPPGPLLLAGILRTASLEVLRAELAPDVHLAPSPDPAFELWALGLSDAQARLLAAADGTKGVADLVRLSDLPERETLAFLHACRVMRVLDEVDRVLASTKRLGFM
jgi:CheY-like chemotaxis protein